MPTKISKQLDQKYVSKDEVNKVKGMSKLRYFIKTILGDFESDITNSFGSKFLTRLKRTAQRRNMSTFEYARKVLLKK